MYITYVLYSESHDRLYIGITDDLDRRISQHNNGYNPSTKPYAPYRLIHSEIFETRLEARDKEIKLKTSSARLFIRNNYIKKS